jgi:hypothetical protein
LRPPPLLPRVALLLTVVETARPAVLLPANLQLQAQAWFQSEAEGGGLRGAGTQCFASSTITYFMMYVFNSYLASNLAQTIMFEA